MTENVRELYGVGGDFIVVETGMGGAIVGHSLAAAGRRVPFLAQGRDCPAKPSAVKNTPPE